MSAVSIAIIVFIVLETVNIIILYFAPASRKGNGAGVFNAFEKSKEYPEIHDFIKYLINWVAGTKLIFILLLAVILITGSRTTRLLAAAAMILSIASFYWRLYPAIRRMDEQGTITPRGYSKILLIMISIFILFFAVAAVIGFFQ